MQEMLSPNIGEYSDWKNAVPCMFHRDLSIDFMESRMENVLASIKKRWPYKQEDIELIVRMSPHPSAAYGIIMSTSWRVFELHILNHPVAIQQAFSGLNRFMKIPTHPMPTQIM